MARYSVRTGRWYGRQSYSSSRPPPPGDDRQWRTEMPGGLIRIDMGQPIPRHPDEPQAVQIDRPAGLPDTPPQPAADPTESEQLSAMLPKELKPRDWRHDYGLAKGR